MRCAAALCATLSLVAAGCATAPARIDAASGGPPVRSASARELALAGLHAWMHGDAGSAARDLRDAVRRDGADPWARMGAALLARRGLDEAGEASHLVALVSSRPDHALAPVAARRLAELAETSEPLARAIEEGLSRAQPRLTGLAAARARVARAVAATLLGERARARALRADNGTATSFTLAGPFGALHALELDTPFAPEEGRIPETTPGAAGLPPVPARTLRCPEGTVALEGEPSDADIFYLATIATFRRGGDYLLAIGANVTMRAFVDGAPVLERRAYSGYPPTSQVVPLTLGAGPHHVLVKIGRGAARAHLAVSLFREDGAQSDATFAPTPPGSAVPYVRSGTVRPSLTLVRELVKRLEGEVPPEVARLVGAREALEGDREAAKALIEEALRFAPDSVPLLALRAEAVRDDPTIPERVGRARAEGDLDRVLAADPGDAASRVRRAELAMAGERFEDALSLFEGLSEIDAGRPRALVARARLARARGLADVAERLAGEARRIGDSCAALDVLFGLPTRRDAVARQDELAAAFSRCPGGLERLVEHRRRRGEVADALAAANEAVDRWPDRIDTRVTRSALLSVGDPRAAAADLADLARTWPRDARIEKQRAEYLEAAGDLVGARAARERALLLDGSDLGLRRALALERGHEPLDDVSEDGVDVIARYRAAAPRYATSSVTVLDFGAIAVHPGGAYTERVHTIVEARDQRAVDHVGEVAVPQGAELLVARTVKADGRILYPEDPLGDKRTLSLTGLEPGDFAEWEWIRGVASRGRSVPGFTADAFLFRGDAPLWRSVYVVTAPADVDVEIDAHRMQDVERRQQDGRVVIRATRENVPALTPEPNAPADTEHVPFVQAGSGAKQDALALAMADALPESFRANREVLSLASEIAASVPGGDRDAGALLRGAYRRVNDLVLGQGAFGEPASAILASGRGNRTVLLKAVLDALGFKSRIALLRDFTQDPAPYRFPRTDLYTYAVLRVEQGRSTVWLDPTTRGTPFGVLPGAMRGVEALVLPAPGERLFTDRSPDSAGDERGTSVAITVDENGNAVVEGRDEFRGFDAAELRSMLERLDPATMRQAFEQSLSRSFRGPSLTGLEVEGQTDLERPLVVHWRARVDRWVRLEAGRAVAETPLFPARLATRFVQRPSRETPLLIGADEGARVEMTVAIPVGWTATPSAVIEVNGSSGSYQRREHLEAGRLVREDRYRLRRCRIPPATYSEFVSFARSVDAAQEQPIVFLRPTTVAGNAGR